MASPYWPIFAVNLSLACTLCTRRKTFLKRLLALVNGSLGATFWLGVCQFALQDFSLEHQPHCNSYECHKNSLSKLFQAAPIFFDFPRAMLGLISILKYSKCGKKMGKPPPINNREKYSLMQTYLTPCSYKVFQPHLCTNQHLAIRTSTRDRPTLVLPCQVSHF